MAVEPFARSRRVVLQAATHRYACWLAHPACGPVHLLPLSAEQLVHLSDNYLYILRYLSAYYGPQVCSGWGGVGRPARWSHWELRCVCCTGWPNQMPRHAAAPMTQTVTDEGLLFHWPLLCRWR